MPQETLFRVVLRPNPKARKVLFYIASYKFSWRVFMFSVAKMRRLGYEVVVYDVNDYMLDSGNPKTLIRAVNEICEDIHVRQEAYKTKGIEIFDAVGSSLGAFLLFNYAVRYPLRKVALNTGGYMARVIFDSSDKRVIKARKRYETNGFDFKNLEKTWAVIDDPKLGRLVKAQHTLFFTSLNDLHVTNEAAHELRENMKLSPTNLEVYTNKHLGHTAAVFKNAHSKKLKDFLA